VPQCARKPEVNPQNILQKQFGECKLTDETNHGSLGTSPAHLSHQREFNRDSITIIIQQKGGAAARSVPLSAFF
jgi:hypothetical protein